MRTSGDESRGSEEKTHAQRAAPEAYALCGVVDAHVCPPHPDLDDREAAWRAAIDKRFIELPQKEERIGQGHSGHVHPRGRGDALRRAGEGRRVPLLVS